MFDYAGLRFRLRIRHVDRAAFTLVIAVVCPTHGDRDRPTDVRRQRWRSQVCVARLRGRKTGAVLGRDVRSELVGTYRGDGLEKLPDGREEKARTRSTYTIRRRRTVWF